MPPRPNLGAARYDKRVAPPQAPLDPLLPWSRSGGFCCSEGLGESAPKRAARYISPVRVLRLTNSDDIRTDYPAGESIPALIASRFEAATGESIDWTVRVIWPSPELPDILNSWIDRFEPDVVQLGINGYWYIYRSVPLKLQRQFGWLGEKAGAVGAKAGTMPWLTQTRGFHWSRAGLLKTIGGATYFTPQEIRDLTETLARLVLRRESLSLMVKGSLWPWQSDPRRDLWMYLRLTELCTNLHVPLLATDPRTVDHEFFLAMEAADRLHSGLAGRHWVAEQETPILVDLWQSR